MLHAHRAVNAKEVRVMRQHIKLAFAALAMTLIATVSAVVIPQIANAGVTGAVGNGPMVFQSGTYTPTIVSSTNVSASQLYDAHWTRVGDVVHVSGRIDAKVTSNTGLPPTNFHLSLPVASTLSIGDLWGQGMVDDNFTSASAAIAVNGASDAFMYWYSNASNTTSLLGTYYDFTYVVK
jgi:hypothetical protein